MIRIVNASVVSPDEILPAQQVFVHEGIIETILPMSFPAPAGYREAEVIDASDGYVAPGFIDIHSDYIEHMAAPRPVTMMDFHLAVRESERELLTHGITTMFHSLSFFLSTEFPDKPIRHPSNTARFVELIERSHHEKHLLRHRFHARYEIDNLERIDEIKNYIRQNKVHLLSFMDHTPGQGQYRDVEMFRRTMKGYYGGISNTELDVMIKNSQLKPKITLERIKELTEMAHEYGIAVASHDDDSLEKLQINAALKLDISEFPISIEVALAAREMGFYTTAGAPNILLGGSHSGNLSAAEAISKNAIDILCSDYYPASLLHAVFSLHDDYNQDLAEMFRTVTLNPARAVNLNGLYGSIEAGKAADILIIQRLEDRFPVVTHAIVDGELGLMTRYRGRN